MQVRIYTLVVLALCCLVFGAPHDAHAQGGGERIDSFDTSISIQSDSSLVVSEHIVVEARGQEIKRGIVRSFPTVYEDRDGSRRPRSFEPISVKRNGQPENYFAENQGDKVDLYIGSKDVILAPGTYTYDITYKTQYQVSFLSDLDELYFNITGNEWVFPIMEASASLRLPAPVPAKQLHIEGYTGRYGVRGADYEAALPAEGEGFIKTTKPLLPGEGLTVVFQWPKALVSEPAAPAGYGETAVPGLSYEELKAQQREENKIAARVALWGLVAVLAYFFVIWFSMGIDARSGEARAGEAPEDISPGALRYIKNMGYDAVCLSAAVVSLATKGYLRIERDKSGGFSLLRLKESDDALPLEERALMLSLFPKSANRRSVSNSSYETFQSAQSVFKQKLEDQYAKGYFQRNQWHLYASWAVILLAWCVVMPMLHAPAIALLRSPQAFWCMAAILLSSKPFSYLLPRYTVRGRTALDQFLWMGSFVRRAKVDPSMVPSAPPLDAALFSRYLPYAIAIGLEAAWVKQLSEQLARQAAAQAPADQAQRVLRQVAGQTYLQPGLLNWYYSPYSSQFELHHLVRLLRHDLSGKLQWASTPPPSAYSGGSSSSGSGWSGSSSSGSHSSFGGGGFSGGGGGGGGGHGW